MRYVKMLSLAAMATMVATAFVGASSAIAVPEHPEIVLCKKLVLVCELKDWAGDTILADGTHHVEIHAETLPEEPPVLLSSIGNVECEHSLAILTLLNKLAKLIEGHLLALNFTGNCHLGSTKCEVTVNALGGLSFTPDEEKLNAIVTSIELEKRNTNATVKCGFLINCTFSSEANTKLLAHSDLAGHLLLLAKKTPLKRTGGFCPEVAEWDATYHAINLDETLSLRTGLWIEL
jgi:hypothetical protein